MRQKGLACRQQRAYRGQRPTHGHCAPHVQPQHQETMMRMVQAAARNRISGGQPRQRHNGGVEQRHQHHQQREDRTRKMRVSLQRRPLQRQRAQQEANRQRAAITHENRCRMKVEYQEAAQRRSGRQRRTCQSHVARPPCDDANRAHRGNSNPGGQSIKPINQVEGVDYRDHPEARQPQVDQRPPRDLRRSGPGPQEKRDHR